MKNIRPYKDHIPSIHEEAFVDESAIVIGDVHIGRKSSIGHCAFYAGDQGSIEMVKTAIFKMVLSFMQPVEYQR